MAQKPPRYRHIVRDRSPSPQYYVDLTVDSPSNIRTRGLAENSSEEARAAAPIARSDRVAQPKKRSLKGKDTKVQTTIDLVEQTTNAPPDDLIRINDSVTGDANVLSCAICFECLTSGRKPTSTPCGHIYCSDCIEQTLVRSNKCPTCQLPIRKKSCIRLYFS